MASAVCDLQVGPHLPEGLEEVVNQVWPLIRSLVAEMIDNETQPLKDKINQQQKTIDGLNDKIIKCVEMLMVKGKKVDA